MRPGDVLEIIYQAKDGSFSQRHIRIIEIGESYLNAFCYNRRKVRIFSKGGILAHGRIQSA
ncbi:hypothetical protein NIE88_05185 [Sporolactobacillus shoreicorticis]|uniref:WYL domain-containing protein n=1 Tax=Sporolactobacillus shoreicorticis TaxID=1923877 RepID=A0ABW5RYG3_9BACL|nr:hypothetical protein [Sporolactobacillus shoreicorticis]MCO7125167.1 hypothetical protein [Sporolactobacillus shoreicorticis]